MIMNSRSWVINSWLIVGLWLSASWAWQVQNGIQNWNFAPRILQTPKGNFYHRSFYGPRHEAQTTPTTVPLQNGVRNRPHDVQDVAQDRNSFRSDLYQSSFYVPTHESQSTVTGIGLQNGIGNARNVHRNWNTPRSSLYKRPFYGPANKVRTSSRTAEIQSSLGNGRVVPTYWNTLNGNTYQRTFYSPKRGVGKTTSPSRFQNAPGRNVPQNWNLPQTNSYQTQFRGPEREVQTRGKAVRLQSAIKKGPHVPQHWNAPNANHYQKPFRGFDLRIAKTTLPLRLQNNVENRPHFPRSWIPAIPSRNAFYQIPLYGGYNEVKKASFLKRPVIMRSNVKNLPFGRSIAPRVTKWLPAVQRNRIPRIVERIRSPVRAFVSTPEIQSTATAFMEPSVTSNYQLQGYAIGRKLEPVPSHSPGYVYNTGEAALQTVLSKVRPSESRLIPESVSNQRATSRTGYIATATEEEQRPVPRKSYVTTSFNRKERRLNDPKLIKLRQILPNLKKRSLNKMIDEGANDFPDSLAGTGVRRQFSNGAHSFDKRSSVEKKSSIRKVKGRQNWGVLNEFTPNVRLATMILLKQKRQDVRKRELNQIATKGEKRTWETAAHNKGIQNVSASKKQNESEISPPSVAKHNVPLKLHHVKSQGISKRHNNTRVRDFINEKSEGFFVSPSETYLNKQFAPFYGMAYGRNYEPYFNTREQFQAAQVAMAKRMRAIRSRGLFHSLGNINPQFVTRNPFRYPAMPMPQQFIAMQLHGMPPRGFPFQYGRRPFSQMQDRVGAPWNMILANRMRESQEEESANVGIIHQNSYKQESVQPNMEENKSSETSPRLTDSYYQNPVTDQSSQIIKINGNGLFEGHPLENSENNDASNQDLYGKMSPRVTGMQITDQSATMLNKWYPLRTGKVSFMPDPRKYSAQWPSRLPGLDVATKFNQLQARGYSALYNPAMSSRFYQDNGKTAQPNINEEENENNILSNWNHAEGGDVAFNQGYPMPFPTRPLMNGIAGEGYLPNLVSYPAYPFTNFPNYGKRKREVRQEENLSIGSHRNDGLLTGPSTDRKNQSHRSNTSTDDRMSNAGKAGKTHSSQTKIHNKKAAISKQHFNRRKKEKAISTRNFVNAGNYFMYAHTPPSAPFYAVASDPKMRLMYSQLSLEDPLNDFERKGYSVASSSFGAGFPALLSQWPLQYTAAGPQQPAQGIQELGFPVGPPQSLMGLSQKVDQFPAQEFLSSSRDTSIDAQRQALEANGDDLHPTKARDYQPETVNAVHNLFSSQGPADLSERPSMQKPRGGPNAENERKQTFSEIIASPRDYSISMSGVPLNIQSPPNEGTPEVPEQSSSEFSEEGTQGMPLNEPQENEQDLTEGGETFSQDDDAPSNGAENEPGESEPESTPGLFDGLDNAQSSLLKQHMGNFGPMKGFGVGNVDTFTLCRKGKKPLPPASRLPPSDRQEAFLRQSAMARKKALLQERATFSTKQNIQGSIQGNMQGNILGGTTSGRNSHMLSLPNLSLNTIQKLIDSAAAEASKADDSGTVHGYGSNLKGFAGNKITNEDLNEQDSPENSGVSDLNMHSRLSDTGRGKLAQNFDWKSPLISQSQSPSDFNWKLERALSHWKEPTNTNRDPANSGGTLSDSPPDKVFVPPKGSNGNPDVVPGYTFDTQGQRSGPLFLPNPPPELGDNSSAETVLMVPGSGNRLKGETGAKKETISKKRSQRKKQHKLS